MPSIDAEQLTQLYVSVGHALQVLEQARGRDATDELWTAYRRIHIQNALIDPTQREAIARSLRQLSQQAADRGRASSASPAAP